MQVVERPFVETGIVRPGNFPDFARRVDDGSDAGFADHTFPLGRSEFARQRHEAFAGPHDGECKYDVRDAVRAIQSDAPGGRGGDDLRGGVGALD